MENRTLIKRVTAVNFTLSTFESSSICGSIISHQTINFELGIERWLDRFTDHFCKKNECVSKVIKPTLMDFTIKCYIMAKC